MNGPAAPGLPPRTIAAPGTYAADPQKTAKEQALAFEANFTNDTYLDAARMAAYKDPIGTEPDARGMPVKIYDYTTPRFIGIDAEAQKYGFIPFTRPTRPADNAPEAKWVDYLNKSKRAVKPPQYQVGAQYTTFENMDQKTIASIQRQFRDAGLYEKNDLVIPGRASSTDFEKLKSLMGEANNVGLTWEEMLKIKGGANAGKFGGGGGSGTSSTTTQISYTQTSIASGRALLKQTLGNAIGRAPSETELKRYMKMLHDAESNSPTRTVTSSSGGASVSRTTQSTVDPADMALNFAKEVGGGDPYRERQASRYLDLIMNRGGLNLGG
jgi:hypothetical protein